jgi:hypothetical protein
MKVNKLAAATAAALGAVMLTLGAGSAVADDHPWPWPNPPGPGVLPPPGHVGQFTGIPPGQWGKGPIDIPFCRDLNPGCLNHL